MPEGLAAHQLVHGIVKYSDGSNIPNGVIVTITDLNNGNWMTRLTVESTLGPGYYHLDVEDLEASNGHVVFVNVSYGGCAGNNSVVLDITGPPHWVNVTIYGNLPPKVPSQPTGNNSGYHGVTYIYSTSTWDPNSDDIYYWFDWGDGTNSGWIGPYSSNETRATSHSWDNPGNYQIKAKAKDEHGAELGVAWSAPLNVTMTNQPPSGPSKPSGLTNGYTSVSYTYSTNATDPNGDNLYYWFDWGDGTNSGWVGPYVSGAKGSSSHSWATPKTYQIKVKVRDEHGLESEAGWSNPLNVTINQKLSINIEPVADFTYTPTNPQVNQTVNFTDESIDQDGTIVKWFWDLGDGTNSSEQNPSHTYTQSGDYQVSLTVTDNENATNIKQQTIHISTPPSNITWEKTTQITLKYNDKNKGINYLVWKGVAINASNLARNTSLTNGDSISIFSKNDGAWLTYTVGISNQSDFQISLWDIIIIQTTSEKTIIVDTSQQNIGMRSVTINFITESATKKSNMGYNFFAWTSNIVISIKDFVETYGLSKDNVEISLCDPDTASWSTYNPSLPAVLQKQFTIRLYSIICIKVVKDSQEHVLVIT